MSDHNPLIGSNPHETLDAMIDLLQSQITLLSRFSAVADEDILEIGLTAADIKGHCLLLRCLQGAAEACYAQCYRVQRQETQADG